MLASPAPQLRASGSSCGPQEADGAISMALAQSPSSLFLPPPLPAISAEHRGPFPPPWAAPAPLSLASPALALCQPRLPPLGPWSAAAVLLREALVLAHAQKALPRHLHASSPAPSPVSVGHQPHQPFCSRSPGPRPPTLPCALLASQIPPVFSADLVVPERRLR